MPHNRQRNVTALLEPPPVNPSRLTQTSIHSPEGLALGRKTFPKSSQSIRLSLYEAADQAIKWMSRLFQNTPSDRSILKFQTKAEVADPTLSTSTGSKVSPDMHILDCAAYFKQQLQPRGGGVTLLTNDKALSLEAELEGISTLRIQPGFSPQSLLYSFDPSLAQGIQTLFAEVSLADMVTANWYKNDSNSPYKPPPHHPSADETPENLESCSSYNLKPQFDANHVPCTNTLDLAPESIKTEDTCDDLSTQMAIEVDDDMALSDLTVLPPFPPVAFHHMLAPSPLYEPKLLHLHYHIQQAVAALLRPRLFHFLLSSLAENDVTRLFQLVDLVFERKKTFLPMQSPHDPNEWTAVDCLTLIDDFWNDATLKLFEDDDNQCSSQTKNGSSSKPRPHSTTKPLISRWAPSTPFMNSDTNERDCHAFSHRLSRTRKAIQVLIAQLRPYDLSNLPRDNPQSWSVLFWEGLLEDIHKLIYYGRFYESLGFAEGSREPQDHLLKKIIQHWKKEARHLCESG